MTTTDNLSTRLFNIEGKGPGTLGYDGDFTWVNLMTERLTQETIHAIT